MPSTFESLRKKLNRMCVQLVESDQGGPCCMLCNAKLPSQAQYDSHTNGKTHRAKSNRIFKQLMRAVLSPGIVMGTSSAGTTVHCVLCRQHVSYTFDSAFHSHILSSAHRERVEVNERKSAELQGYYEGMFSSVCLEDVFLKGVSRAGIVVAHDGLYHCVPCDHKFANRMQFIEHVKGDMHRTWVFSQLSRVADKVGLSLGVVVEEGSLVCKLCVCELGDGLATSDAYHHVTMDLLHKKKVQEQVGDGVYEYYDYDDDDCSYNSDKDDYYSSELNHSSITRMYDEYSNFDYDDASHVYFTDSESYYSTSDSDSDY